MSYCLSYIYRYLASGDSMMSLKYQYYIDQSTITNIITETCKALWEVLMPIILAKLTYDDWKKIAEDFEVKCHFPHCIGAVDGKHVVIQVKSKLAREYVNKKIGDNSGTLCINFVIVLLYLFNKHFRLPQIWDLLATTIRDHIA